MPSTLQLVRQRRTRRSLNRGRASRGASRFGLGLALVLSLLLGLGLLALGLAYADLTRDLPSIETLPLLLDPLEGQLLQPTRLYDRSGEHLIAVLAPVDAPRAYFFAGREQPLARAVVAALDPGFWNHAGWQWTGWQQPDLHPTLAQRLASDLLLWEEPGGTRRALRERILAAQITARYGRLQVLEWSLNSLDFGRYAYGAEAAAQLYFGKSARDLSLAEAAALAAAAQAPALNPLDAPQAARERAGSVLGAMTFYEFASAEEIGAADPAGLTFAPAPAGPPDLAPGFTALALEQLSARIDAGRIARGGLVIRTAMDYDLQLQAECALAAQIARALGTGSDQAAASDGGPCEAGRLLPALTLPEPLPALRAGVVIVAPQSGQVLAVAGDQSAQEAGSLLAPFIYLTGFTRGLSPATLAWDIPDGTVENYDGVSHGPIRLRIALANDYRVPAAGVLAQMGAENVARTARSFGIEAVAGTDWLRGDLALTPLQAARAYAILANNGTAAGQALDGETLSPVSVLRVDGVDGAAWLDWGEPETHAVVTPQLAYIMNNVLADEVARWPSLGHPNPFELGRPSGAKPGRVEDGLSAWAAGYTPNRVAVVWAGSEADMPLRLPAGLWYALMQYAGRDLPPDSWWIPPGVSQMDVCDPSGLLPSEDCPAVVSEVFLNGNEPVQVDDLYRRFQVNRETGLLATVFTPSELVEERVYLMAPAGARAWAEAAGLPVPPESYDAIQIPPVNPDARIDAPALFADLRGVVAVRGTARANDFSYYRIQVGQGLNPRQWLQIGTDVSAPVEDGLLAEWDTSGLNGLYALRLLVVHADQQVDIATIQVTIDNTAPELSILFPKDGQALSLAETGRVNFQAQAGDNLGPATVEFFLNGRSLGALESAPYSLAWDSQAGVFTLRAVATDRTGNQSEQTVRFEVTR